MSCGTPFIVHFATTFTTLGFRKKNIFIIFYYVHYAMVMSKRNKISFQCYVHDLWLILGFFFFFFFFFFCAFSICRNVFLLVLGGTYNVHTSLSCANINCYYGHYAAIMTKKYILSFQHYYIHYTVVMRKNCFLPYC